MTGMEIAALVALIAAAATAYGSIQAGEAANEAAKANAKIAERQARMRADDIRKQYERERGQSLSLLAAAGVESDTGSALELLMHNAREAEIAKQRALYAGESEAAIRRFEGKQAKRAGYIQGGTTLLTAVGDIGMAYYRRQPRQTPSWT